MTERFIKAYTQYANIMDRKGWSGTIEVWVDTETGVNYLFRSVHEDGAGLTPLIDANGKPVVTPIKNK